MSTAALESTVAFIGWSHLLQPPTTFWLASRVLHLRRAFDALPVLPRRVVTIMGLTSILLPTAVGVTLGWRPAEALSGGALHWIALLIAGCLWTPRLLAQIVYVGPAFPSEQRAWHWVLVLIFFIQGPLFLTLLLAPHGR